MSVLVVTSSIIKGVCPSSTSSICSSICKVIYTTNAIESLTSVIRKSVKTRKVFPNDNAAMKVIYLAVEAASKKWTMPIRDWKPALNRFIIEFEEQLAPHV